MRRKDHSPGELNLVPIMNLVSILIPFLLVAAQFVNLAVVDTSLPGIQKDSDEPVDPPERQLSIAITDEQILVLGANDVLGVEDTGGYAIPNLGQDHDTSELTRVLGLVKDETPEIEDVVLVPDGDVSYEELIDVMDAARSESQDEGGRLLFPNQVIAGGI